MRNHSFSSLTTTNYDHDIDHLDEDSYDLNLSVSSLAKLNRRKPQISTILKLNLIVVLIISLFIKLTVVSIINGSFTAFLGLKLLTHGLILYTFIKKHYISLQLLFVLDVILFVIFLLFEFLLLVSNFAIIIIQHKRNKNLGFIAIWLMILIAAIDLLILVMVAIVLENYRKPKERLQQLESKLVTVVHNGRLLASQMCKSGSYLLGYVCNSSTTATGTTGTAGTNRSRTTSNNGMLLNGTPRIYRDSENPNQRISCIDTQETSNFSLNDDEYIHFSSFEIASNFENQFNSFTDFYNFSNRNRTADLTSSSSSNPTSNSITNTVSTVSNNLTSVSNAINNVTSATISNATTSSVPFDSSLNSSNITITTPSNIPSTTFCTPFSNPSTTTTFINSSLNNYSDQLARTTINNPSNSLINATTTTADNLSTTLATSSIFGTSISSTQLPSTNQPKEHIKNIFDRAKLLRSSSNGINSFDNSTISSLISSNTNSIVKSTMDSTNEENENTYVHMYQSNVDEDGQPCDGPLRCTRTTVINSSTETTGPSSTVVQVNRGVAERVLNCKPVYI